MKGPDKRERSRTIEQKTFKPHLHDAIERILSSKGENGYETLRN